MEIEIRRPKVFVGNEIFIVLIFLVQPKESSCLHATNADSLLLVTNQPKPNIPKFSSSYTILVSIPRLDNSISDLRYVHKFSSIFSHHTVLLLQHEPEVTI